MKNIVPINTCRIGDIVDVYKVPHMRKVEVIAINDSGVSIKGPEIGLTVISGATEISEHDYNAPIVKAEETKVEDAPIIKKRTKVASIIPEVTSNNGQRAKRGSLTKLMENIKFPFDKFTIGELAEHNGIPVPYALKWVKDNCIECGKADKAPGQRGRAATIYKKA